MRIRESKSRPARLPLVFALSLQILYFSGLTRSKAVIEPQVPIQTTSTSSTSRGRRPHRSTAVTRAVANAAR